MKIVFVSTMMPSGHYSQILTEKLSRQKDIDLIIYADDNPKNLKIKNCGKIKNVWSKGNMFAFSILKQLKKDKPKVVHLQHEFNMYGGLITAVVFPLFVLWLRLHRFRVVVTVHSVVPTKQIDKDFISLFNVNKFLARPLLFKVVFSFIYRIISKSANKVIVHTHMMSRALIINYGSNRKKIHVIETAIPKSRLTVRKKGNYFFYFGYLVKRKGLNYVLDGFSEYVSKHPKSDFKFIMAGGAIKGQEKSRDEIIQSIKDKKLGDRVKYVGFIDQKQQDELYNNAYAVILPAKISIAASGPLYYSFSYRKCPLASKVGNLKEEVRDGKTGLLIPNSKWSEAFEFAVRNPKKLSKIEENISEIAKERSPQNIAKKYADLYCQSASGR